MDYKKYILPHIWNLKPYSSARDEFKGTEGIFLDANENPIGSGLEENYNRYPDPLQWQIKGQLSQIKKCSEDEIFLGNGSDEAIDLLIRMTCTSDDSSIIVCPPTYGMYEVSASINNVPLIKVNLTSEYQLNTDSILKAIDSTTRLIFICSPNNPTGNLMNREDIYKILDSFKTGFVVIDEAYIDFSEEPSFIQELNKFPQLIVLQTLSKAYGLASLRLGMAFANPNIIKLLNKIKPPYNIGGATQRLVQKALRDSHFVTGSIQQLKINKQQLIADLKHINGVSTIFHSDANFILVKFIRAQELFDYLISQKIIARNRSNVELCNDSIRITIGLESENKELIQKIKIFYTENNV
jgi:histidinol-phosphate aminotransferase